MIYAWKLEYSVGVKEIDNQHKKIFEILGRLHIAIKSKREHEFLAEIIQELVNYSVYHFETEEKYFDKFKYEFTEEHKKQHQSFKEEIREIMDTPNLNEEKVTKQLLEFVIKWIKGHVTGADRKYIKCFQENGLK
jgi:hemerythrin